MTVAIRAQVNPADLARLQAAIPIIAKPALEHIIARASPYLQQQASANAPQLTGALARSIGAEVSGFEGRVRSALPYALPEEFGRHSASGASARPRRGMQGRFFLRRAIQMLLNGELPRLFNIAIAELEAAWSRR